MTPPLRSENGYRTCSQQHLDEPTLLRQARQVGFNTEECRELVALFNDPSRHSADVKTHAGESGGYREPYPRAAKICARTCWRWPRSCPGDDSAECPIIDNLSGCCHRKAQA